MHIQVRVDLWLTDNLPGVHKLRLKEWTTGSSSHKRSDQIRVYGKCFENIFGGNSEPQSVVGLPCFRFSKHWHRISRLWTPSAALHIISLLSNILTHYLLSNNRASPLLFKAEQQTPSEQCVPNNFWSIYILVKLKKDFVTMLHWSHWPIHSASIPNAIDNPQNKTQIKVISIAPFLP